MMDRRTFLAGTGAILLAAPLAAEAQQTRVHRVGVVHQGGAKDRAGVPVCRRLGKNVETIVSARGS